MAYKYQWHLENVWLYRAIQTGFSSSFAVTVFGNTQPSANSVIADWSTTYYNQSLAHFTGAAWTYNNPNTRGSILTLSSASLSTTGLNDGNVTWGILWTSNISPANANISTLPSNSFIIVPAGDLTSNSVVRLSSANVLTSATVTLEDLAMSVIITN